MDQSPPPYESWPSAGGVGRRLFQTALLGTATATAAVLERASNAAALAVGADIHDDRAEGEESSMYEECIRAQDEVIRVKLAHIDAHGLVSLTRSEFGVIVNAVNTEVAQVEEEGKAPRDAVSSQIPKAVADAFPLTAFNRVMAATDYDKHLMRHNRDADPEGNAIVADIMSVATRQEDAHVVALLAAFLRGSWTTLGGSLLIAAAHLRTVTPDLLGMVNYPREEARAVMQAYFMRSLRVSFAKGKLRQERMAEASARASLYTCLLMALTESGLDYYRYLTLDPVPSADGMEPFTPLRGVGLTPLLRALAGDIAAEYGDGDEAYKNWPEADVHSPDMIAAAERDMVDATVDRGLHLLVLLAKFDFSAEWDKTSNVQLLLGMDASPKIRVDASYDPLLLAETIFPKPMAFFDEIVERSDRSRDVRRACHVVREILTLLDETDGQTLDRIAEEVFWLNTDQVIVENDSGEEGTYTTFALYPGQDPIAALVGLMFARVDGGDFEMPDTFLASSPRAYARVKAFVDRLAALRKSLAENGDYSIKDVMRFLRSVDTQWPALVARSPEVPRVCVTVHEDTVHEDTVSRGRMAVTAALFGAERYDDGVRAAVGDSVFRSAIGALDQLAASADAFFASVPSTRRFSPESDFWLRQVIGFMYLLVDVHRRYDDDDMVDSEEVPGWEPSISGDYDTPEESVFVLSGTTLETAAALKTAMIEAAAARE